jgi:hypothetical protein
MRKRRKTEASHPPPAPHPPLPNEKSGGLYAIFFLIFLNTAHKMKKRKEKTR